MTHQMLCTVSMAAWSGNINLDEKVRACHFFCKIGFSMLTIEGNRKE